MAMTFDPFTELDRIASSMLQSASAPRVMPVDLYRDQSKYVLTADLPGVDPGSVDIDVDGCVCSTFLEQDVHEELSHYSGSY